VVGEEEGSLEYAIHHKKRFRYLMDDERDTGKWAERRNVRSLKVTQNREGEMDVPRNSWLSVKGRRPNNPFGPDVGIGWVLGECFQEEPILLIKACSGGSLGLDFLPPGSSQFEVEGTVYAGYKDSPSQWEVGSDPEPSVGYAGKSYDVAVENIKAILADLKYYYPQATDYEIAGFFSWHGDKDTAVKDKNGAYVARFEQNLVQLVRSLRHDFDAPEAPFVCATIGLDGREMKGPILNVWEAQMAIGDDGAGKYPDFCGNVKTVDIRDSWRNGTGKARGKYWNNAETFMEVGNAMGLAMAELLSKVDDATKVAELKR
jgi:hypothetical protein